MRPELELIRHQFSKPEEQGLPQLMCRTGDATAGDRIVFVHSPREFQSVLVQLGTRLIFLPGFAGSSDFYERFLTHSRSSSKAQLGGYAIDLPTTPLLLFDEDPKLMLLTVPPEDRKNHGCNQVGRESDNPQAN